MTPKDPRMSEVAEASAGYAGADEGAEVPTQSWSPPRSAPGVFALAWPAVVANLLYSTVGFVGTKIVGALGAPAVAAVTTGNRIFFILQAVLMAVTAGTTALVARAWGAQDREEAERVATASLVLCVGLAGALTIPGMLFCNELARIFRLDAQAVADAATFIWWLSVFNAPFAASFVIGTALRAAGDTRTPLWIGAITNVVNIFLAYGLVLGRFGMPKLGVAGAAIANGLSFSSGAVIFAWLWLRGRLLVGPGPGGSLSRPRLRRMLQIGYPAALEQVVWQGGFIVFLWIVALYGTAPYAAYGIGVTILSFSFVVGFGFSIAAGTLVGQHLGAEDPAGAARSGWRALRLSIAAMVVLGTIIVVFARSIAEFMIADPEVVELTVFFIYVLGAMQPLMAIEFALGGALRGAGDTRFPLLAVLAGLIDVRVTLAALFAWLGLSVHWVFAALIGDYIVKATMLTWRFASGRWKSIRFIEPSPTSG
jgi:putative MATE family efflux protein